MTYTLINATAKLRQQKKNARAVCGKINFTKPKLVGIQQTHLLLINVIIIEDVDEFCYLGSQITKDGDAVADVAARNIFVKHELCL